MATQGTGNSLATFAPASAAQITPDWFLKHYAELYPRYIANGRPTFDTVRSYRSATEKFLKWCQESNVYPLAATDYIVGGYMQWLIGTGCGDATVALDLTAIRIFFLMAMRLGLIKDNPCRYMHAGTRFRQDEEFEYFTTEEIGKAFAIARQEKDKFICLRNECMVVLMGIEGLRVVELHRMCDEDIDWRKSSIYIRGKGHAGRIYPARQTMELLSRYLAARPKIQKVNGFTPTFVSDHRHNYERISREGIRYTVNRILVAAGLKRRNGVSCHAFRHSCGTNLYKATKDLRLVQETLRQRNPKVTARYAHVQERMENRATEQLLTGVLPDGQ